MGINRKKPESLEQSSVLQSIKKQELEYSLQKAMNKLAEMSRIISEDVSEIYLKKMEDIDPSLLKTLALSFTSVSVLFREFLSEWSNSKIKKPDTIEKSNKLEDRIDINLYQTGNHDFNQPKMIMIRLNRIDESLRALDKASFRLKYYEEACLKKGIPEYAGLSELFSLLTKGRHEN